MDRTVADLLEATLRTLAADDGLTAVKVGFAIKSGGYFSVYAHRGEDTVGYASADTIAEAYRQALEDLREAVA